MTTLRQRKVTDLFASKPVSGKSLRFIKELDAFSKVDETYQQTSSSGGTLTILSLVFIVVLVISEISYYTHTKLTFAYEVDSDFASKVRINVDMVVAMPCATIGADVLDVTGQNNLLFGQLEEEDTNFDLSPLQRQHWSHLQSINSYISEEYHAIHDLLWLDGYKVDDDGRMPDRETPAPAVADACRLHGVLHVNKLAGNFHVTAGKSFPLPAGHAHISAFLTAKDYNFSHRITKFSFGEPAAGAISPLDFDEKITTENYYLYQYTIKVVPTRVHTHAAHVDTHQYSVTDSERTINHSAGSHGLPGIYFKYDFSSMRVKVHEVHKPYWQFLVRLCGIVGGVFTTAGLLNSLFTFLFGLASGRRKVTPTEVAASGLPDLVPPTSPTIQEKQPLIQHPGATTSPTTTPVPTSGHSTVHL